MKKLLVVALILSAIVYGQFGFNGGLGFNLTKANADDAVFELLSDAHVTYESNFAANLGGDMHIVKGDSVIFDGQIGSALGYNINKIFKLYVIGGIETRASMLLDYRVNLGMGGKITYYKSSNVDASISLIPLFNNEKYTDVDDNENTARLSFRSKVKTKLLDDKLRIGSVIFYKPKFEDFSSFIIDSDLSVMFRLNKVLFVETKYNLDVDINNKVNLSQTLHQVSVGIRADI